VGLAHAFLSNLNSDRLRKSRKISTRSGNMSLPMTRCKVPVGVLFIRATVMSHLDMVMEPPEDMLIQLLFIQE